MYEIYETEALALKIRNQKESDRRVLFLTKDFGLIWVNVSGAKKIDSKFKALTEMFSFSKIFLVRGKNGFRMTGGFFEKNIFFELGENKKEKILKIQNFLNLMEKFLIKNHQDSFLFNLVVDFLEKIKLSKKEKITGVELLYIIKLLHHYGYFDLEFLEKNNLDLENIVFTEENKKIIIQKINEEIKKIAF